MFRLFFSRIWKIYEGFFFSTKPEVFRPHCVTFILHTDIVTSRLSLRKKNVLFEFFFFLETGKSFCFPSRDKSDSAEKKIFFPF